MEEITDRDAHGGCFRGVYYFSDQLRVIVQYLHVRQQIVDAKPRLMATGSDPDGMLAKIDRDAERLLQAIQESRESNDSLLEAEVKAAEKSRELSLLLCRQYLYLRDGLEEHLAGMPYEDRANHLEIFGQLKEKVHSVSFALPLEDLDALRAEGWRDSDWEMA